MRSIALFAGLALAVGCGGGGGGADTTAPPATPPTTGNTVTVGNNFFAPAGLTIQSGATVTWQWASDAAVHNVTFDAVTRSDDQSSGTYTRTFTAAGTYPYSCTIHGMRGTISVTAAGGGSGGGSGGGGYDYGVGAP
jgi:plastocyanin